MLKCGELGQNRENLIKEIRSKLTKMLLDSKWKKQNRKKKMLYVRRKKRKLKKKLALIKKDANWMNNSRLKRTNKNRKNKILLQPMKF